MKILIRDGKNAVSITDYVVNELRDCTSTAFSFARLVDLLCKKKILDAGDIVKIVENENPSGLEKFEE